MVADPVSPELVLVCPELRERALAALPPLPWEAFRPRTAEARRDGATFRTRVVDGLFHLAGLALPLVLLAVCAMLLTLGLTLLAGAVR